MPLSFSPKSFSRTALTIWLYRIWRSCSQFKDFLHGSWKLFNCRFTGDSLLSNGFQFSSSFSILGSPCHQKWCSQRVCRHHLSSLRTYVFLMRLGFGRQKPCLIIMVQQAEIQLFHHPSRNRCQWNLRWLNLSNFLIIPNSRPESQSYLREACSGSRERSQSFLAETCWPWPSSKI